MSRVERELPSSEVIAARFPPNGIIFRRAIPAEARRSGGFRITSPVETPAVREERSPMQELASLLVEFRYVRDLSIERFIGGQKISNATIFNLENGRAKKIRLPTAEKLAAAITQHALPDDLLGKKIIEVLDYITGKSRIDERDMGTLVRLFRENNRLSLNILSTRAGVAIPTLKDFENGSRETKPTTQEAIAQAVKELASENDPFAQAIAERYESENEQARQRAIEVRLFEAELLVGITDKSLPEALIWLREFNGLSRSEVARKATAFARREESIVVVTIGVTQIKGYETTINPSRANLDYILAGAFALDPTGEAASVIKGLRRDAERQMRRQAATSRKEAKIRRKSSDTA